MSKPAKPAGKTGETEDLIKDAVELFDICVRHEQENRADFKDDMEFARKGDQWPAKVRQQRELEGKPCLTINKLPAFIRQVVNDARQNKPSITVHPADDTADPETAEVIEGLIRNIEVTSNADVAYDTSLDCAVSGGWGYIRVNTAYADDDTFDQDIVIEPVPDPLTIYGDPYSNSADSADWDDAFVVTAMPKSRFEAKWKDAEQVDWENGPYSNLPSGWEDGETIMVAEWWHREPVKRLITALNNGEVVDLKVYQDRQADFEASGVFPIGKPRAVASHKVTQRTMTGVEVLETVEWPGKYIPIIPVYGEDVIVDGKRILRSLVRDAKDSQRRVNYHTSTVTELVALAPKAPYIGRKGAFETDAAKWETANTENWAYIEYDGPEAPQRQSFAGVPAGEMQNVLLASDDMKTVMGLHDASLGMRSNETSGRAILARQHEGDVSTFNFVDNLSRAIRHLGRVIIDLIPHVYSVPRIVRVLGPDGTPKNVPINQETPPDDADGPDDEQAEMLKVYDLTAGKYDLVVKVGPSYSTRREEAANQMTELVRAFPQAAGVLGDLLAKNLDWPDADEVAKRLHALLPPQVQQAIGGKDAPQAPPGVPVEQVQQMAQQVQGQMQQLQAALQEAQAELQQMKQDRAVENRKLDIEAFKAQTERLQAQREATMGLYTPPPEQLAA